jgi:4-amino-4-deoxychorismate lyase
MTVQVLVNGKPGHEISVFDRGLQYGDGLFETLKIVQGRALFWDRHMDRLERGCERLGLSSLPRNALWQEAEPLVQNLARGVLKLIVTRGEGERGYQPPQQAQGTRIWVVQAAPAYPPTNAQEGVRIRFCETRLGHNPRLAGIKHLNRLEQVLARAEWDDPEIAEGLMLDGQDNVIEGVMSNLFVVSRGHLLTPDLSQCGVAGVIREWVLETVAKLGMVCRECPVSQAMVNTAEELFLTNSLMGIWPVRQLEAHPLAVGPVTRRLQKALEEVYG